MRVCEIGQHQAPRFSNKCGATVSSLFLKTHISLDREYLDVLVIFYILVFLFPSY